MEGDKFYIARNNGIKIISGERGQNYLKINGSSYSATFIVSIKPRPGYAPVDKIVSNDFAKELKVWLEDRFKEDDTII